MVALNIAAFGLRGGSAAAKFLLVLYVASLGSNELLGQIAILTTITALFTQVAGFEINQVVGRQLHSLQVDELALTLRGQAAACLVAYLLLVPTAILAYAELFRPYWFFVGLIFILEHFITEVYRLNILLLRPVFASCILFIKNAGWVILFISLTTAKIATPTFQLLLYCWSSILLLTAAPLIVSVWRRHWRLDGSQVLAAFHRAPLLVKGAFPFMASAILTASAGAIDKLIIGKVFLISELGEFFFFSTLASILSLVVTFSVGSTVGPACIKIHSTQGEKAFLARLGHLKRLYWATILATASLIVVAAGPLLGLLKNQINFTNFNILILLVTSAAFNSLCDPYKLEEYLAKRDSSLVIGNAFQFICLVLAVTIGANMAQIGAVAFGVMLSSLLTFLFFFAGGPRGVALILRLQQ